MKRAKSVKTQTIKCPRCKEVDIQIPTDREYMDPEIAFYFACKECSAAGEAYWGQVAETEPDAWVSEEFDES